MGGDESREERSGGGQEEDYQPRLRRLVNKKDESLVYF